MLGLHMSKHTEPERDTIRALESAFENSPLAVAQRLISFPRHVRRQDLARFLTKYELFKLCLPVHGNVVELGVFAGAGLFTWLHCSAILEPYNHQRRVLGFDTFEGFPALHDKDADAGTSQHLHVGAYSTHRAIRDELEALARVHDRNRPLGHVPKLELVAGDATETIPRYVREHPHLLVSLLYLDFDLYDPTRVALEHLLPRVPKGGVVAFDELNCPEYPGETTALIEKVGLDRVELRRFTTDPGISYYIKE
jgi:hypothetical protein